MADTNSIFQNSWYIGNNFNAILYGIELALYFTSVWLMLHGRERRDRGRSNRIFLVLSTGLLCMITIFLIVQAMFGQEMWILNEGYPGGTAQYFADHAAVWYETLGSASSVVLSLMSDAFLIYRTYIVWNDWRVAIFPSVLYCCSAVLGIMTCYYSGKPNADFFLGLAANIALSYSSIVIGLNFTCTVLICVRILWVSGRLKQTLGREASRTYTGAAALIIESMLPYTLFGIAYVATLGVNHPTSILFLSLYVMFTCISPQMIILRVLLGRGWTKNGAMGTSLAFRSTLAHHGGVSEPTHGGSATAIHLQTISKAASSVADVSTPAKA
ncbi:hypothetical protein K466DRAFT_666628 [Polyporus arcularius HHB13444]|uniref:Uncharacterized protein n=1 Tax=Polyporus arcularius HHB13444 TaxID=1314778 RepID=A0A5C3NY21_9APHY|nr:hypothetical protein K466DRAFT_666628 [Polyporus arcularius HHB13444]